MLLITGAKFKVEGLEHIDGRGPYIIMSNHRSHVDTPLLIEGLPFLFGFIVKKELMKIPMFAAGMRGIGCVAVSRTGNKKDYNVLDDVARQVASGKNILIFPEGTRAPTEAFLPFKKGGAVLAIKAGVPVLPVAVSGTNRIIPARSTHITPGDLLLRVGKPIPTQGLGLEDRDKLIQEVRDTIEKLYVPNYGVKN
jgi:1-acyl-sn-glycerol-3-phosphate acyltransferase